MKPKKVKKAEQIEQELCDAKTAPSGGVEACQHSPDKVSKKRTKAEKLKSSRISDTSTEAEPMDVVVETDKLQHSIAAAASRAKRRPAKLDRDSGVVRIIEKSQRKRPRKTVNIEEAVQLDIGHGSYRW